MNYLTDLCGMYFKSVSRTNPDTGNFEGYYRLVESYRNSSDRVCHRTLLNIGFLPEYTPEQLNKTRALLVDRCRKQPTIFNESDKMVLDLTDKLWGRLITEKRIDVAQSSLLLKAETIKHKDVREIGSEWLTYNMWEKLELSSFLHSQSWNEEAIKLAATQVISRAVYPASENKTSRWIRENSAVCELTGYDVDKMTKDKLYGSALKLYSLKDELEKHLSNRTNDLFDLDDKIILFDLSNTYFEGRKENSKLAKYGRSKEKRNDAKLVVLAMVVNIFGFVKYTSIYEGNMADSDTLEAMIDKLATHTIPSHTPTVVIDAGIATEDNLELIKKKGYHYVCVSRVKLKEYQPQIIGQDVLVKTKNKQNVTLRMVKGEKHTDYFLEVVSTAKAKKEEGMKNAFESRYEEELTKIESAIHKKGGIKKTQKVFERIGRAKEKYPSVHALYKIETEEDKKKGIITSMEWNKITKKDKKKNKELGVYFVRTDLKVGNENLIWSIYNTIREIESSFRCLKTDLDLRPIYHKNDDSTMAHLHLGILAYWLVNTMRHQLKQSGIKHSWKEIIRIGNTQKTVLTQGQNTYDEYIFINKCSEPKPKLIELYEVLKIKHRPFRKRKYVVHKATLKKNECYINGASPPI